MVGETSQAGPGRVALVGAVVGDGLWILAGLAYAVEVATCFSCADVVVAPGTDTSDFSAGAIRVLAWDALYANLYIVAVGVLAVLIALTAFRRGERWARFAMAVFAAAGIGTAVLDQLAWGGWYTFLFLGLLPTLAVGLAARRML